MHFYVLALALCCIHMAFAETQHAATTIVVFVTVPRSTPSTPTAIIQPAAASDLQQSEAETTLPSLTSAAVTSIPSSQSQIHQATSTEDFAQATSPPSSQTDYSEPGSSNLGGGQVDTAGGASGSDAAAFHLSKGGLAAILIVVILVVLFGSK